MSIARMCPYDKDEHCKYERYFGEPMFSKCENCEIKKGMVNAVYFKGDKRKMTKAKHYCDNINCNHNDTKGLCCLFNPDNCKYRQLQKENAELKEKVSFLEDNLRVARKDREDLQLDVAKGLKEFVKDYPATALRYLANEKYVEQLTKAKKIIKILADDLSIYSGNYQKELLEARQFLSEVNK